ncbi:MAG: hypothetical protein FWF51_09125 [Chitinivibrionia bacterium]|nr:hypothetical protein [Chitinivibrionia bacterium]
MPKDILRSPVIFCNGSQLSHAGRTAKSRTVIERNDLYLLSELNNADFEINTERGNVPTVNFFIKSKEDKTVLVVVKNFEKFTANTKNSSIITFYYK